MPWETTRNLVVLPCFGLAFVTRPLLLIEEYFLEYLELRKLVFQVSFLPFLILIRSASLVILSCISLSSCVSLSCSYKIGIIVSFLSALLALWESKDTPHMGLSSFLLGRGGEKEMLGNDLTPIVRHAVDWVLPPVRFVIPTSAHPTPAGTDVWHATCVSRTNKIGGYSLIDRMLCRLSGSKEGREQLF